MYSSYFHMTTLLVSWFFLYFMASDQCKKICLDLCPGFLPKPFHPLVKLYSKCERSCPPQLPPDSISENFEIFFSLNSLSLLNPNWCTGCEQSVCACPACCSFCHWKPAGAASLTPCLMLMWDNGHNVCVSVWTVGERECWNSPCRWMTQARCCWHICPHRWLLVSLQEPEGRRVRDGSCTYCRWDTCEIYTCSPSVLFVSRQCFHLGVRCDRGCSVSVTENQISNRVENNDCHHSLCHLGKQNDCIYFLSGEGKAVHPSFAFQITNPPFCFLEQLPWQLIAFPVSL